MTTDESKCQDTYAQATYLGAEPPTASLGRVTLCTPSVDILLVPSASGNHRNEGRHLLDKPVDLGHGPCPVLTLGMSLEQSHPSCPSYRVLP